MKTLLAITTANQWEYTDTCLLTLKDAPDDVVVRVYDDASIDGTPDKVRSAGFECISKPSSVGLTDSWNKAYHDFRDGGFEALILSNNDVLYPKGSIDALLEGLKTHVIVGPTSTTKGVGHQPEQAISKHHELPMDETDPEQFESIQQAIADSHEVKDLPYVNGFCFAMNRRIIDHERTDGNLFDPSNVNVGNEDELCRRVSDGIGTVTNSFIFHFKGMSFQGKLHEQDIHSNIYRDLTWEESAKLENSAARKLLFKLKKRLS